jgi:hypothetical protein
MAWTPAPDPLTGLTDDARLQQAIADRAADRSLRDRAAEAATFVGTLHDLAERGAGVGLTTVSGRQHRGVLLGLATDHVVLGLPAGGQVLVALASVATARPDPTLRATAARGERDAAHDLLLVERCAVWTEDRPAVAVAVVGAPDLLRGRLEAVGEDVVTVVPDGSRQPVYVAATAIEAVARP